MLRAIETGRHDGLIGTSPHAFVYFAAGWLVSRSAGLSSWDPDGPRYVLSGDSVVYAGTFAESRSSLRQSVENSTVLSLLDDRAGRITTDDVEIYVRIIERANRLLLRKYRRGLVILHVSDGHSDDDLIRLGIDPDSIARRLRGDGMLLVDAAVPDAPPGTPQLYQLRTDGHPTGAANVIRADSLRRYVP
jgi:hypothetical protein